MGLHCAKSLPEQTDIKILMPPPILIYEGEASIVLLNSYPPFQLERITASRNWRICFTCPLNYQFFFKTQLPRYCHLLNHVQFLTSLRIFMLLNTFLAAHTSRSNRDRSSKLILGHQVPLSIGHPNCP